VFLALVEEILVLPPITIGVEAVEVVSASLHPRSVKVGFLLLKSFLVEVGVHVNRFARFHREEEPMAVAFFEKSGNPVVFRNT
jgi:hypothetical protein